MRIENKIISTSTPSHFSWQCSGDLMTLLVLLIKYLKMISCHDV